MENNVCGYGRVNVRWLVGALICAVIALLSFIIAFELKDFYSEIMSYVAVASTLLSITLSVFAIMYTYVSNAQIQLQFDKINTAADLMCEAAKSASATAEHLDRNIEGINKKLGDIEKSQDVMNQKISSKNEIFDIDDLSF